MDSIIILCNILFELIASEPPFSNRPLPDLTDNAITCGKTSGRDSNITNNTPIGVVICFKFKSSDNSFSRIICPIGSS